MRSRQDKESDLESIIVRSSTEKGRPTWVALHEMYCKNDLLNGNVYSARRVKRLKAVTVSSLSMLWRY